MDGISWDSLPRRGRGGEDREIEVRSKGRKDIQKAGVVGGGEGSCIAEATEVEAEEEKEEERILYGGIRRLEGARNSGGVGLLLLSHSLARHHPLYWHTRYNKE